jgi:hypothetical protein
VIAVDTAARYGLRADNGYVDGYYRILMGDFSAAMTNGKITREFTQTSDFADITGHVRMNIQPCVSDLNVLRTSDNTFIHTLNTLIDASDTTNNKLVGSSKRANGSTPLQYPGTPTSGRMIILGTEYGRGEWLILKLEGYKGEQVKIEIIESYLNHFNSHFHVQKWKGSEIPPEWTVANTIASKYLYLTNAITWTRYDDSFDTTTIQYNLPEGPSDWEDVATVPRNGGDYEYTLATNVNGRANMKKMTSTTFTL